MALLTCLDDRSLSFKPYACVSHWLIPTGTLLLTKKSPEAAAAAAVQLFQAARQYTHAIAANQTTQPNIVTQILTSQFANITNILGTKLAEYLPSKVGIDRFR